MYECPTCGGNLRFDIPRQKLYCDYCGTQIDPYQFPPPSGAEEEYQVTIFICPQCGGQIISEDTTAATFCSFCGASTILDSRISKERRPQYILPFTKTKEDCRAAYGKLLRRAIFAPKELKDEKQIEKFRGIYMPYWVYSFEKKEPVTFYGRKTRRRGDYLYTDHYQLDCQVEEAYKGLAYDASSTFSDSLSNAIAPFDLGQGKAFVPAFLSGFYADTSDVEHYVYLSDAEEMVLWDAGRCLAKNPLCRKYHASQGPDQSMFQNALRPTRRTSELAMLPVWFLAYRNGDRVSYAVVNGQTGKAAADLPVDKKKYLIFSVISAVPLFFLLNRFFTITPGKLLGLSALLAVLCILISNAQLTRILERESGEDDKGLSSARLAQGKGNKNPGWERRRGSRGRSWKPWDSSMGIIMVMIVLFYGTAFLPVLLRQVLASRGLESSGISGAVLSAVMMLSVMAVLHFLTLRQKGSRCFGGGHFREKCPTLGKPLAGIILALLILLANPVSDWFYYTGAVVCMGTVLWAIMDIIRQHNLLATRKLPQLNPRGGDEA